MTNNEKQERLEHANALIKIIASHGRRFFWHRGSIVWNEGTKAPTFVPADRYAQFELRKGRVYFVDEYTGKAIYTHRTVLGNGWRGFSHGGTLRALVEDMRDYILNATPIPRWKIVIQQRSKNDLEDNIWGYDVEAALAVRAAAYALPIIALPITPDISDDSQYRGGT
jgi:hypothetical protein